MLYIEQAPLQKYKIAVCYPAKEDLHNSSCQPVQNNKYSVNWCAATHCHGGSAYAFTYHNSLRCILMLLTGNQVAAAVRTADFGHVHCNLGGGRGAAHACQHWVAQLPATHNLNPNQPTVRSSQRSQLCRIYPNRYGQAVDCNSRILYRLRLCKIRPGAYARHDKLLGRGAMHAVCICNATAPLSSDKPLWQRTAQHSRGWCASVSVCMLGSGRCLVRTVTVQ